MTIDLSGDRLSPEVQKARTSVAYELRRLRWVGPESNHSGHTRLLEGYSYRSSTANALLYAARRHDAQVHLLGRCIEDLVVSGHFRSKLNIDAKIDGSFKFSGSIEEDLILRVQTDRIELRGPVRGSVAVYGKIKGYVLQTEPIEGDLKIEAKIEGSVLSRADIGGDLVASGSSFEMGSIGGDLEVHGRVGGNLSTHTTNKISGYVNVGKRARILQSIDIGGSVAKSIKIEGVVERSVMLSGSIGGSFNFSGLVREVLLVGSLLHVPSTIKGEVEIGGTTEGPVDVRADLESDLEFSGFATGTLTVSGPVVGAIAITGWVGDRCLITGQAGALHLTGRFDDRVILTPSKGGVVPLVSVRRARFADEVFVGQRVSIDQCDFRQCADLGMLNLTGTDLFPSDNYLITRTPVGYSPPQSRVQVPVAPWEEEELAVPHREMASIYRQLRSNLEGRRNRPAARRFYLGEMEARRLASLEEKRGSYVEAAILSCYRALSLYGQSARLPMAWFGISAALTAIALAIGGVDLRPTYGVEQAALTSGWSWSDRVDLTLFAVQSLVSFVSPPTADSLTSSERAIQLVARFVGPLLIAQFVLAIRERVRR